ncbi:MAG: LysR family transcriptional regulator [Chitinophagales bacterium]|nr:LysR family transcriptional regulator [Chitinophagales bacterium]
MTLKQLEYLRVAVTAGTLKQAAKVLGISQPAVTTGISALETSLNVQLINRTAGNTGSIITTTEAGEKILGYAKDVQNLLDTIAQTAREYEKTCPLPGTKSVPANTGNKTSG